MAITPDRATEVRAEHIAELRAALEHAVRLLHFSAGREAATDPKQSAVLTAAAEGMTGILARTAP